jgi:hypothetical protein
MKLLVAILAVLALVGSAMAWELSDSLTYSYTKAAWQEAGNGLILEPFTGATSQASFYDPGSTTYDKTGAAIPGIIPQSGAEVRNELETLELNTYVRYPDDKKYDNNDAAFVLTQGGSAAVKLHSPISDAAAAIAYQQFGKIDTPEIMGTASAYQNLNVAGGFGDVDATFDSQAAVGADNLWAVSATKEATASVDSNLRGGGCIESANMGVSVESDILKNYDGTGWDTAEYSGGITMWANFVACDPGCSNPVVATVSGSVATSAFPGVPGNWGGDSWWGKDSVANTNPFNSYMPDLVSKA